MCVILCYKYTVKNCPFFLRKLKVDISYGPEGILKITTVNWKCAINIRNPVAIFPKIKKRYGLHNAQVALACYLQQCRKHFMLPSLFPLKFEVDIYFESGSRHKRFISECWATPSHLQPCWCQGIMAGRQLYANEHRPNESELTLNYLSMCFALLN